jgi:4-hydroxybenzoate polyprenyltransferase
MSAPLRPAPPRQPKRDPLYKPVWKPNPLRDAARALGRTLVEYGALMRLHRPVGFWLLMWPTLWGLWISADGRPDERIFIIFMLGVLLTRSVGCIINDYADRDIDPHVRRTRDRPLAAGRVGPGEALALFVGLGLLAVGLALLLEPLAQLLAVVGAVLAVTYPFMKRFIHLPQFYLGAAFGWGAPMAFAAQTGEVPRVGWLLLIAAVLWAAVYDTIYAMVDRDDDLKIGIKSTAILFGDADRVIIAVMQAMVLFALYLVGRECGLGSWYQAGLAVGALMFAWEQWLIRRREPERCFQAFNHCHLFGMSVFIGIALDYLFR